MADPNQEILEFRVDNTDAVKETQKLNETIAEGEQEFKKVGESADAAKAKIISFSQASQSAISRSLRAAEIRAAFAGLDAEGRRLMQQQIDLKRVSGDTRATEKMIAAHKQENDAIRAVMEAEKQSQTQRQAAAEEQKRQMEEQAARAAQQREVELVQQRALYAGLNAEQKRAVLQAQEIERVRGNPALLQQVLASHAQENKQIADALALEEKRRLEKQAQRDLEKQLTDQAAQRAAVEREVANVLTSAMTPMERLAAQRQRLTTELGGNKQAVAQLAQAFATLEARIKAAGAEAGLFNRSTATGRTLLGLKDLFEGRTAYGQVEFGTALTKMSGATAVVGGFTLALGALAVAAYKATESLATFGQGIREAELRTGLTADQVQRLSFAAKAAGQDFSVFENIQRGLTQAITGTGREAEKSRDLLASWGVNVNGLQTGTADLYQTILKISQGLQRAGPQIEKNADAMELFRRAGIQSIPVFLELTDKLKLLEGQHPFGVSEADVQRFAQINTQIQLAKTNFDYFLKVSVEAPLAKSFLKTADAITVTNAALTLFRQLLQGPTEGPIAALLAKMGDYLAVATAFLAAYDRIVNRRQVLPGGEPQEQIPERSALQPGKLAPEVEAAAGQADAMVDAYRRRQGSVLELQKTIQYAEDQLAEARTRINKGQDISVVRQAIADADRLEAQIATLKERLQDLERVQTLTKESRDSLTKSRALEAQSAADERQKALRDIDVILPPQFRHMDEATLRLKEFQIASSTVTVAELAEHTEVGKVLEKRQEELAILEELRKKHVDVSEAVANTIAKYKILIDLANKKDMAKAIDEAQKAARALDDELQAAADRERERQQRFGDETVQYATESAKLAADARAKEAQRARDAELAALDKADAQTLQAKIALEQQKAAIEIQAINEVTKARKDAIDAQAAKETEAVDKARRDMVENAQALGLPIDENLFLDRYKDIQKRRVQAQIDADKEAADQRVQIYGKAADRIAEQMIETDKKVFERFKSESEKVIDALFSGRGSFVKALENAAKAAVLTPLKDILSSRIAAALTPIITGHPVTLEQQYQGQGPLGRLLTRLGVGAVPTFHVPKLEQPGHLGDLVLTSGRYVPVVVMNAAPVTQSVNQTINAQPSGGGGLSRFTGALRPLALLPSLAYAAAGGTAPPAGQPTVEATSSKITFDLGGGQSATYTTAGGILNVPGVGGVQITTPEGGVSGVAGATTGGAVRVPGVPGLVSLGTGGITGGGFPSVLTPPTFEGGAGLPGPLPGTPTGGFPLPIPGGTTGAGGVPIPAQSAAMTPLQGLLSGVITTAGLGLLSANLQGRMGRTTTGAIGSGVGGALAGSQLIPQLTGGYFTPLGGALVGLGIGVGLHGLAQGGVSGLVQSTAGFAEAGFFIGGPIGAAIGAGVGLVAGLIRLAFKTSTQKLHDKIKAAYGVDVKDQGILQQLANMAKQQFGGNLDATIYSQQGRQLIALYAETTGQRYQGIQAIPVASQFAQSGGQFTQVPAYYNGQPVYPGQLQTTVGYSYLNPGKFNAPAQYLQSPIPTGANVVPHVTLSLDGASTQALLQGQAVQAIQDNPRLVSVATISGQDASAGRRDAAVNVLQPNFIVS